jgi:hypothetical protein
MFYVPVEKLPPEIVERLRRVVVRAGKRGHDVYAALGELKNIDPRQNYPECTPIPGNDTENWGRRVRQVNIKRNLSDVEVVIKRVHGGFDAQQTIQDVHDKVAAHNERYPPEDYILMEPAADPIGKDLVAMPKNRGMSIMRLAYGENDDKERVSMLKEMEKNGVDLKKIREVKSGVYHRTRISGDDMTVEGVVDGKIILLPTIDIETDPTKRRPLV